MANPITAANDYMTNPELFAQKADEWAKANPQAAATLKSQQSDSLWDQIWGNFTGRYSKEMASARRADAKNQVTFAREDSAIQRQIEDAKAAGINPYLMQNAGSGAGVGNYAEGETAQSSGIGSSMMTAFGSVVAAVASKAVGAKMLGAAMAKPTAATAAASVAQNAAASYAELRDIQKGLYRAYNKYMRRRIR